MAQKEAPIDASRTVVYSPAGEPHHCFWVDAKELIELSGFTQEPPRGGGAALGGTAAAAPTPQPIAADAAPTDPPKQAGAVLGGSAQSTGDPEPIGPTAEEIATMPRDDVRAYLRSVNIGYSKQDSIAVLRQKAYNHITG